MAYNVEIRPLALPAELPAIVALWNHTLPAQFTITEGILSGHLDLDPNYDPGGVMGAFTTDGQLVGVIIGKRWQIPNHDMASDDAQQWVRDAQWGIAVIFVAPDHQRAGVGSQLLKAFEKFARENGAEVISIGREPGRHMFPGVPESLEDSLQFFEKHGYGKTGYIPAIDIIGDISGAEALPPNNPKLAGKITQNRKDGFDVVKFRPALKEKVFNFMRETFPGKWYWTVKTILDASGDVQDNLQVLIQTKGKATHVCGFAYTATQANQPLCPPHLMHSQGDATFGGIGPIGIARDLRGSRGIGAMLLHLSLVYLRSKGVRRVLIDWTSQGLLQRYYGPAGFKLFLNYISVAKEFE